MKSTMHNPRVDDVGTPKRSYPVYDVNTKAALGMIHARISTTEVNNFLAVMDAPPISTKTLKKRERKIGLEIKREAKRSCTDALKEESRSLCDNPQFSCLTECGCCLVPAPIDDQIPSPKREPLLATCDMTEDTDIVLFDLETTGTGSSAEITQIAATSWDGTRTYNRYVLPNGSISSKASEITGIEVTIFKGQRCLRHKGKLVETLTIEDALHEFIHWVKSTCSGNKSMTLGNKPVLCAHNARTFDMRVICRELQLYGLQTVFARSVAGFMDTLPAFKNFYLNLSCGYSQGALYERILGHTFDAHNALEDVKALRRLLCAAMIPFPILRSNTYTTESALENVYFHGRKNIRLTTLKPYLTGTITAGMMTRIAASGLEYDHLRLRFDRGGGHGLRNMLKALHQGRPRVTSCHRVLKALVDHFSDAQML